MNNLRPLLKNDIAGKPKKVKQCPACNIPYDMLDYHLQTCSHCMFNADYNTYLTAPLVPVNQ
jgi:hypothetical protein